MPAIGLAVDPSGVEGVVELSKAGTVVADRFTLQTSDPRVFAGGDVVRGPATLVEAIGDGQRAAFEIERFLTGRSAREELLNESRRARRAPRAVRIEDMAKAAPRVQAGHEAADERVRSFAEVVHTITADEAVREACRCLRCDLER